MFIDKDNGHSIYETFDELINAGIVMISEYGNCLFVRVKPEYLYDNSIWVVDKKTGEVTYMMFTDYITNVEPKAKLLNPEQFK